MGDCSRRRRVLRRHFAIAEQRERHDRDIDVAVPLRHLCDELVVARRVVAVECNDVDDQTVVSLAGGGLFTPVHVTAPEHHRPSTRAEELAHDGQPDVAGATEQQDGLRFTECVVHVVAPSVSEAESAGQIALPDAVGIDRVAHGG